jgi:hypothetical protein
VTRALAGLVVLTAMACSRPAPPPAAVSTTAPGALASWTGRWPGVEGTSLDIARDGDRFVVTIADLDGPKTYAGTAAGDHIEFVRAGRTETIRAATGRETGMKWLADETNCLVITAGSEGFCRR